MIMMIMMMVLIMTLMSGMMRISEDRVDLNRPPIFCPHSIKIIKCAS